MNADELNDEYARYHREGFEYALRNCLLALRNQIDSETNEDRKLGLEIARDTVASYQGFLNRHG